MGSNMKQCILALLLITLINSKSSYSQTFYSTNCSDNNIDKDLIKKDSYKLPRFDLHIGAGLVDGGRVGIRTKILKNYSLEFFYGNDLANFVSATDVEKRYGLGINWHRNDSNFVISLLIIKSHKVYLGLKDDFYVSPNFGWMTFKNIGFQTFFRVGPAVRFSRNTGDNSLDVSIVPNIDVGISFVIF
jgi:hypothetical protein